MIHKLPINILGCNFNFRKSMLPVEKELLEESKKSLLKFMELKMCLIQVNALLALYQDETIPEKQECLKKPNLTTYTHPSKKIVNPRIQNTSSNCYRFYLCNIL